VKLKDTTVQCELHPTLTDFLFRVDAQYRKWDSELIITSGSEESARHGITSLHYAKPGCAVDVRTHEINNVPVPEVQRAALEAVKEFYCEDKDIPESWIEIILEKDHIHIEFQPKRKN
jgi:hypothetical protein